MAPILNPPTPAPSTVDELISTPGSKLSTPSGGSPPRHSLKSEEETETLKPVERRIAEYGLLGVRLAIGFEFLWAFFDKVFGLGWSTDSAHAWINGGSPTTGFLSGVSAGPLQGFFHGLAGTGAVDWLFMMGLLGVGVGLMLGVAIRPAAIAGSLMLLGMYLATWPEVKWIGSAAKGAASGSTNVVIDEHIVNTMALIVVGALAAWSFGPLSRRWSAISFVKAHSLFR